MIRIPEIRVIDENGEQLGVMATDKARAIADEKGLDLVEIAANVRPPVCKIMDYGKYRYEQKRKEKQNVKKQHNITLKEIRLRPKTDAHDRETKLNHARKFFEKGHRVQFTMMFRGREMLHIERGHELMEEVISSLEDIAKVDRAAKLQGRRMTVMLAPK